MTLFATPKMKILAAALVVVVLAGIAAVVLLMTGSGKGSTDAAGQKVPDGYTSTVTVPTIAPNVPKPAQAAPKVAPPKIYSTGKCATAMDTLRGLMHDYPSGLALDTKGNARLNAGIAKVGADCDAKLATAFQQQELAPWMNYAVPAGK